MKKILIIVPIFPVIIISRDRLYTAYDRKSLTKCLSISKPLEGNKFIQVLDRTAEEFWLLPEEMALAPGFTIRGWTKKEIINLFNNSLNAWELGLEYPLKVNPKKTLSTIISEKYQLIKKGKKGR